MFQLFFHLLVDSLLFRSVQKVGLEDKSGSYVHTWSYKSWMIIFDCNLSFLSEKPKLRLLSFLLSFFMNLSFTRVSKRNHILRLSVAKDHSVENKKTQ